THIPREEHVPATVVVRRPHGWDTRMLVREHLRERSITTIQLRDPARDAEGHLRQHLERVLLVGLHGLAHLHLHGLHGLVHLHLPGPAQALHLVRGGERSSEKAGAGQEQGPREHHQPHSPATTGTLHGISSHVNYCPG